MRLVNIKDRVARTLPRRRFDDRAILPTINAIVASEAPCEPLHCLRPATVKATARDFCAGFFGKTLYAVKCNPDPRVLRALWAGGVRHFDCASATEVSLVRQMFANAAIHFMHPVKSRAAIREAWQRWEVRDFVLDSAVELDKIVAETEGVAGAGARGLLVRIAVDNDGALLDLSGKFGATAPDAVRLLRQARSRCARLGVTFHVGSQCMQPRAYANAIARAASIIQEAGVTVDILDVGGGFPAPYPGRTPPPLPTYFAALESALSSQHLRGRVEIWAEPGRALVAAGVSVIVQVLLRRGDALYVNDGVFGSLADAGPLGFRYPTRLIRATGKRAPGECRPFSFYGPTCDAADRMNGPFWLPSDVREGDWIEVGQLGAYGAALRTAFNGFDRAKLVEVSDPPLAIDGEARDHAVSGSRPSLASRG